MSEIKRKRKTWRKGNLYLIENNAVVINAREARFLIMFKNGIYIPGNSVSESAGMSACMTGQHTLPV